MRVLQRILLLGVVLFFIANLQPIQAQSLSDQGIKFSSKSKWKKIKKAAKKSGKPIFLDFRADWCLPCTIMEESTFLDYHLGKFYNENFHSVKVDVESKHGKKLQEKYGISQLPSFIYLDKKGKFLLEETGSQTVDELMNLGKKAKKKSR